jgi:hypothetical protein
VGGIRRTGRAARQPGSPAGTSSAGCVQAAHPHLLRSEPYLFAQHSLHVFSWVLAHCNQPVTVPCLRLRCIDSRRQQAAARNEQHGPPATPQRSNVSSNNGSQSEVCGPTAVYKQAAQRDTAAAAAQ